MYIVNRVGQLKNTRNLRMQNCDRFRYYRSIKQAIVVTGNRNHNAITSLIVCLCSCLLLLCNLSDAAGAAGKVRCKYDKAAAFYNCTCPEDPITDKYPDPDSETCDFFYLCHFGIAVKMRCDMFWAFHPKAKECMPRDKINKDLCTPEVNCSPKKENYMVDKNDCTQFYLCLKGKAFHYSCSAGQFFDKDKEACINDKAQSEKCIKTAKKKLTEKIQFSKEPIQVSLITLAESDAYKMEKKRTTTNYSTIIS